MYDIAPSVAAYLRAGTGVHVAWVVQTTGFSTREHNEALALTPGGGMVGALLSGALDDRLSRLSDADRNGRLLHLHVSANDAAAGGLSCGGEVRLIVTPAAELPARLWDRLLDRQPAVLVSRLDGDRIARTELFDADSIEAAPDAARDLYRRGTSSAVLEADAAITVLWPVPSVVVLGSGQIATALGAITDLLGWEATIADDGQSATGLITGLAPVDKVVVMSHDVEVAGPVLLAALESQVGYIGALGARHTQAERAEWLRRRGVSEQDLRRIHGPAGLDIGARTPVEVAIAIAAEALAVAAGRSGGGLKDRSGPIHDT